ncbi:unnamed protein product, partial (macronuclear) [Paramecium tetraurelia]
MTKLFLGILSYLVIISVLSQQILRLENLFSILSQTERLFKSKRIKWESRRINFQILNFLKLKFQYQFLQIKFYYEYIPFLDISKVQRLKVQVRLIFIQNQSYIIQNKDEQSLIPVVVLFEIYIISSQFLFYHSASFLLEHIIQLLNNNISKTYQLVITLTLHFSVELYLRLRNNQSKYIFRNHKTIYLKKTILFSISTVQYFSQNFSLVNSIQFSKASSLIYN